MKVKTSSQPISAEADMTPMIDMTFQLIAFFMVLLNFGEGEQDARIKLPGSELAKPPDAPFEAPIVLQLTDKATVLYGGGDVPVADLQRPLKNEADGLRAQGKSPREATIIIRADAKAKTGVVQEVIQACQQAQFEKFALRVRQDREGP